MLKASLATNIGAREDLSRPDGHLGGEYSVDAISHMCYTSLFVSWEVVYTDEFETWWHTLSDEQQEHIDAAVEVPEERGPALGRPLVETLSGSGLNNLKEL